MAQLVVWLSHVYLILVHLYQTLLLEFSHGAFEKCYRPLKPHSTHWYLDTDSKKAQ